LEVGVISIAQDANIVDEGLAEDVFLQDKEAGDLVVDHEVEVEHDQAEEDSEQHLVLLTLVDALLPNVELQVGLLAVAAVAAALDVEDEPASDALQVGGVHQEERLEGLTEREGGPVGGVLAFVGQVEHLDDDRVLEEVLHVHFEHDIQRVLALSHVEDALSHKSVQLRDVVLHLKILRERVLDILIERRALSDERVDLLPLDLPGDAVDEQRVLDGVVLAENGVGLDILAEQDFSVDIDELVQLLNCKDIKILVNEEQLHLVVLLRSLDRTDENVHDLDRNVGVAQVLQVDLHGDLERVGAQADAK